MPKQSYPPHDGGQARPDADERLWTIEKVADYLDFSVRTVQRLVSRRAFPAPCIAVGNRPRWRPEKVKTWVAKGGRA